jgi:hypothetical protein
VVEVAPVVGCGLNVALPLAWTPPTTRIDAASRRELPLAVIALEQLELTATFPPTSITALPDSVSAPQTVLFRT